MHPETERLLNLYLAALDEFYDAHNPTFRRWVLGDPNRAAKQAARARLEDASFNFWLQVEVYEPVAESLQPASEMLAG